MIESADMAQYESEHPFVIMKSSGIYGKEVLEIPSLVYGSREKKINKIAVCMTMTELGIELAGAAGVDAIVAHHPVADAASCGGVTLKNYLDLYQVAVFRSEEHTSELQSRFDLVCRLLLEKKKKNHID